MTAPQHDRDQLGAYALGRLHPDEARAVQAHLAGCLGCRREVDDLAALRRALDEVPPEAFLDGPPDADLLLRRTLRDMAEREPAEAAPRRRALVAAAVVALALVGGGFLAGRGTAPSTVAGPTTAVPTTAPTSLPPNARTGETTDPATGAAMSVRLLPQAGWVRVNATVKGAPQGAECLLRVTPRSGAPVVAGSWLVSELGSREGTTLDGSALVDPAQVASVDVVTTDGAPIVSVTL